MPAERHRAGARPSEPTPPGHIGEEPPVRLSAPAWGGRTVSLLGALLSRRPVWLAVLAALQLPGAWLVVRANAPGRANVDIAHQAKQALGLIPFDDWHPPVMSALWKLLHDVTGSLTPLFFLQVLMLFGASWLISAYLYGRTGSRLWSLAGIAFPLLPHTVSQIGVLWKDTQMACALLCGIVILFWVRWRKPSTLLLMLPSLVFLVYASATRKNALFAVLPVLLFIGWQCAALWEERRQRRKRSSPRSVEEETPVLRVPLWRYAAAVLAASGVLLAGTQGLETAVGRAHDVQPTGQISQILLDDVIFSVPPEEIEASDAPQELKDKIAAARRICFSQDEIWDAYWNCYGRGATGEDFSPIAHQEELRRLWLDTVPVAPVRYLKYRGAVFMEYLSTSRLEYWMLEWDKDSAPLGLGPQDRYADVIVRDYVIHIGVETLPWLFKPWFWLLLSVVMLVALPRVSLFRAEIALLASSGALYILGYFPIVPANHFRYTYWPALAITLAVILMAADLSRKRRSTRSRH